MNSARKKCWKKIVGKKCEKRFFIFTRITYQKMDGKNARNNFSGNTRIVRAKNGEKIVGKSAKNFFYIHSNIVTKKWGEKMRETIFPQTHE